AAVQDTYFSAKDTFERHKTSENLLTQDLSELLLGIATAGTALVV
ncbi:hypothetical protein Goarm_018921, partial [Gossypium armourianum]|nr:hypothetical protein [Gossypium armourianum]